MYVFGSSSINQYVHCATMHLSLFRLAVTASDGNDAGGNATMPRCCAEKARATTDPHGAASSGASGIVSCLALSCRRFVDTAFFLQSSSLQSDSPHLSSPWCKSTESAEAKQTHGGEFPDARFTAGFCDGSSLAPLESTQFLSPGLPPHGTLSVKGFLQNTR